MTGFWELQWDELAGIVKSNPTYVLLLAKALIAQLRSMVSTSPYLPELSFTQEGFITSHSHPSESYTGSSSAVGAPSFPKDAHRKQLPPEPIESSTSSPVKPKSKHGKKSNPLIDLVETEETYVTMLAATIRKVAAAWSRTNFPPKELDSMFRGIEAIFKANRRLLSQLKEIDQNPNNPNSAKALGDLLMNWIVDLEKPYTKFADNYAIGFSPELWAPLASNTLLPSVLQALTAEYPPESFSPVTIPSWSLDSLFALPQSRLKYYRKLYTRLLKSTEAGRNDYDLLVDAIGKLDRIINVLSDRSNIAVHDNDSPNDSKPRSPERIRSDNITVESDARLNHEIPLPSDKPSGPHTLPDPPPADSTKAISTISDLEQKIQTDGVLDLFTLNSRPVQLQLSSPSLPFTRTIRCSEDVEIHFTPRANPENVQFHPRGRLFLLTDLMLLCERISSATHEFRLLYPPLAGKHLRVSEMPNDDTTLQVLVLKRETLNLRLRTKAGRDRLLKHFNKCVEEAAALTPGRNQSPPPPIPPLKPMPSDSNVSENVVLSSGNSVQEFQPRSSQAVNEIPIGGLSINQSVDHVKTNFQGNDEQTFHEIRAPAHNPKRTSFTPPHQLPSIQSDFPSLQSSAPSAAYIPPPRGASNHHPFSGPQSFNQSHPYPNPIPGQLQPNVTIHQRSLTPSLPHSQNQQQLGAGYSPYDNPMLRRTVSATSLNDPYQPNRTSSFHNQSPSPMSYSSANSPERPPMHQRQSRDSFSAQFHQSRSGSIATNPWGMPHDTHIDSPAGSPEEDRHRFSGPVVSTVTAQFKCKVFLKVQHGQWKSLGSAKMKLYLQQPTNVKQLVVESEAKDKQVLISTIVLTDGVERVGKTGVAIELSDKGARTGIVYMIQLRNDTSANGLFDSLLAGSDRAVSRRV